MAMNIASLSTDRLDLSAPRASDVPEIVRLANNYEVVRTLARLPHPYGPQDAQYFLDVIVPAGPCWRVAQRSDAALIGFIGFKPIEAPAVYELGYWFGQDYWGQGYATEAARAVVAHAFSDLGVQKILSGHFATNLSSGRVLAKIGFQETGRSELYSEAVGETLAHVDMMLDAETWRRASA